MGKMETEKSNIFTKEQILLSKRYENEKDAIQVILEDKKLYSLNDIDGLLDKFMKGKVK